MIKYGPSGHEIWRKQWGSEGNDSARPIAIDSNGRLFLTGGTKGLMGTEKFGESDIYVAKLDSNGNEIWTTQFGYGQHQGGSSLALDNSGNIYITGHADIDFDGSFIVNDDLYMARLDPLGNVVWADSFGTAYQDLSWDIAVHPSGIAYIAGQTEGNWGRLMQASTISLSHD